MKIAHLVFSFSPGGAEMLVRDIVLNSNTEHTLEVWSIGKSGDPDFEENYRNELLSRGITVVSFNKIPHQNRTRAISEIRKAIKIRKPDIIHTHSEIITIYSIFASLGLNKILIETIHNTVISFPVLHRFFIKHYIKKYVAISKNTYNLIRNKIGVSPDNIEIIFNGIDIRRFHSGERIINNSVKRIIAVGRLDDQKDHLTLLKSFVILKDILKKRSMQIPDLMIVGIGRLQNTLQEFITANSLDGNVVLTGARSDIPELLESSDLWVMSSRWEGLSIALLEALASGIPVVATDVGSNNEVIQHGRNGSLVPKENPNALAKEILKLIQDKNLRIKYSTNSIKTIDEFSIMKCAAKYNSLYSIYYNLQKSVSFQQY